MTDRTAAATAPPPAGPEAADVHLEGVVRRFGAVTAVDHLDLTLPAGRITALLGPSGCGKTTTLRLVAGFDVPDGGRITIGGRAVAGPGTWVGPEDRRVGMVFQHLALFPHLDVAANIGYGLPRRARRSRVRELVQLVGLAGLEGRYPDQLSGGQAQRVALARALAPRPRVLLLDEPFSSLDVALRGGLRSEVRAILEREGVTTLLVTHDQDEALSFGDRVAVMLGGRLAQVGAPDEIYLEPASVAVARFVGEANLLPGQMADGVVDCELGRLPAAGPGGEVVVLLRPEMIDVVAAADGDAVVRAVEYHGHDQLLRVALASGTDVLARLPTRQRLVPGARVRLGVAAAEVRTLTP